MKDNHKIVIADDESSIRMLLTDLLSDMYEIFAVEHGNHVIDTILREDAHILILDIHLPGIDGIEILKRLQKSHHKISVVVLTASNDAKMAITAMRLGAYDYIVKPFDNEKLLIVLKNIVDKIELESEVEDLRDKISAKFNFSSLIGNSPQITALYSTISKVIDTDSTILISGASGTGKGVLARAIHYNSIRRDLPFRALDCSTIPKELIASELFGHEKGSFTGAHSRSIGKFEAVGEGTLFLDEISNLSFDMQAKLLMVIQERQFERIGGNSLIHVNARIIAATNRDLREMVKEGTFREDLYYRLHVVPLNIPELKNRQEDIPLFIEYFLKRYNKEYQRSVDIDFEARTLLSKYSWPGNVRQLENMVRRLVLLADRDRVVKHDVQKVLILEQSVMSEQGQEEQHTNANFGINIALMSDQGEIRSFEEIERDVILRSIEVNNYNITKTAETLKISRKTLHNKINRYNIVIAKKMSIKPH